MVRPTWTLGELFMARTPISPQPITANLTPAQMLEAIPRIERRISELEQFDPSSVIDRSDPRIIGFEKKMETLLDSVFGHATVEFNRYKHAVTTLDCAGYSVYGTPINEVIGGLVEGKNTILHNLKEIVAWFKEEIHDRGTTPVGQALRAYQNLDLHPEIVRAADSLFRDGHYAEAIENSVKALNALVRLRSGVDYRDGSSLMEFVFAPKSPVLKFNALSDQNDHDEQKGFMMMMSGAVSGLRNPRAHKIIKDDPESALEFIAFVSLLAKLVDKAKK
jgi:uncharacterized protein (TIGR02391 family)